MITYRLIRPDEIDTAQQMLADLASDDGGVSVVRSSDLLRRLVFAENAWLRVVFAVEGEVPIGLATFNPDYSSYRGCVGAFVGDLFVVRSARGRGIGRGLIAAVARFSQDWATRYVSLMVHRANGDSGAFYQRTGFVLREDSDYLILEGEDFDALRL